MKETRTHTWMDRLAAGTAYLGVLALILLLAQSLWSSAYGQDEGGFRSGGKSFSNPFAPPGGGGKAPSNFFDDDEDEDYVPPPSNRGASTAPRSFEDDFTPDSGSGSGSRGGGGGGRGRSDEIKVGGGLPGGVIQKNQPAALRIDDETAEGSKEVITDFNFPDADIMDIAKTLGKLTGKNFILDKDVKGKITIISNSPITVGDAWKAFLTALDINGFALIPSGKYIRIARQRDARDKQLKTYTGDYSPDTDALITRLFSLKYLSAEEVARNFRSFMPANSRIIPYEQTNTVIVTDTGSNISKMSKFLEILDVEGYDAGIEVVPVKYASAVEISKLIDSLLPGTPAGQPGGGGGAPRFGGAGGSRFAARRTKEGGIINTVIADERTNTLIVHANGKGADQVRELVAKLDQKLPANVGGGKVHVVYLQFAEAEAVANTLNALTQNSGPRGGAAGGTGTGVNPTQTTLFEGSIKVAPDKSTNALVVTASPADFVTVQRVINRLDIPRDQVYAEVVIMEVSVGRDSDWTANVIAPTSGLALAPSAADVQAFYASQGLNAKGLTLGFGTGGNKTFTVGGQSITVPNIGGLIQALQTHANGNVLATPQILTLDNTEAEFESAENVPVPQQNLVQGVGQNLSFVDKRVSLSIKIKPQINKLSNFVKMEVTAKLADFTSRQLPDEIKKFALPTQERVAKTQVVVADKDTVVFGGLTRETVTENGSKVPILGDIPVLGWLFRSKTSKTNKNNLLIFITPTILRPFEKVRALLDKKLAERDEFLETNSGGTDPHRKQRDRMIRGLPEVSTLMNNAPPSVQTIDRPPVAPDMDIFEQEATKPEGQGSGQGSGMIKAPPREFKTGAAPIEAQPVAEPPSASPGFVPAGPMEEAPAPPPPAPGGTG
ncbi:MAG: type II secretion system secretin GspD [Bdellovibrionales bacterium]|nr:type II secretion system secretin GspD [Bdellovibrionales bacterium]